MSAARPSKRTRGSGPARTSANRVTAIDAIIGRNVRVRRLASEFSQTQLAKHLGVTFQQVQKYEKGTNRIGAGRLARIAQVLEVPLSALLEHTEDDSEAPALSLIADRRALRLAEAFAAIEHAATRLSLVELVEEIAAAPARRRR